MRNGIILLFLILMWSAESQATTYNFYFPKNKKDIDEQKDKNNDALPVQKTEAPTITEKESAAQGILKNFYIGVTGMVLAKGKNEYPAEVYNPGGLIYFGYKPLENLTTNVFFGGLLNTGNKDGVFHGGFNLESLPIKFNVPGIQNFLECGPQIGLNTLIGPDVTYWISYHGGLRFNFNFHKKLSLTLSARGNHFSVLGEVGIIAAF